MHRAQSPIADPIRDRLPGRDVRAAGVEPIPAEVEEIIMSATTRARSSARSTHDGFVPIIDISPLFSANSTDRRSLAKQIDKACRDVGFYVTTGHNVRASLLADVEAEARNFFDLPLQ